MTTLSLSTKYISVIFSSTALYVVVTCAVWFLFAVDAKLLCVYTDGHKEML